MRYATKINEARAADPLVTGLFVAHLPVADVVFRYGLLVVATSAVFLIVLLIKWDRARRIRETLLRERERRLVFAIAGSQGAWWDIELVPDKPHGSPGTMGFDPSVKRLMGFEDDEFPSSMEEWRSRIVPEDAAVHAAATADHLAGKTPLYEVEYRVRHKDGRVRWIYTRGRVQRDEAGRPIRWSGIDWDVTDSKQTESQLQLLTRAVEQSPTLVIITDTEGCIEYVNPRFTSSTGYSAEEALGRKPSLFKSDETPPATFRKLWQTITAGHTWQGELRNKKKDGTFYWVNANISAVKNASGVTQHYLAVQEDITERRAIEARLAQSQRLESVGQLVSGVAHDFNNLLTAVIGFAEIGLLQAPEGAPFHREFVEIRKAGESASDLTRQLLAFSRRQLLEPRVLDLNDIVKDTEVLLRRTISEDIKLELCLDSDLGATRVDPAQIGHVLINLALNARDAMAGMTPGGQLTITTSNVDIDSGHLFGTAVPDAGRYVLLAVTDTGHGMDEETQKRVFEPFFTTKTRGHGTGLGLSTVYGVVKQSGGFISLYSQVGLGTSFKIYFPRVTAAVEQPRESVAAESQEGHETVLVVEDNAGVRRVATRTLESRGYRVLSCADAEEAIRIFSDQEVDLLLTDVVLPGISGASLAQSLHSTKPDLRVLLMSGYAERSVLDAQGLDPKTPFLKKPFRLDDLLVKVRSSLERPR